MKPTSIDIPLNDIMPLVEVQDYSLYWFAGLVVFALFIAVWVIFVFRGRWGSKKINERAQRFELLSSIDLSNPKKAAYAISEHGYYFAQDNERTHNAYHNLFARLEPYKYAPRVDPIDPETVAYYRLYLEIIDV